MVEWITAQLTAAGTLKNDSTIAMNTMNVHSEYTVEKVRAMAGEDSETAFHCITSLLDALTPAQRSELAASLSQ